MSLADPGTILGSPVDWPRSMDPRRLATIDVPTPFLATDLTIVEQAVLGFSAAMPSVHPHYAVKCNSAPEVLSTAARLGTGFEIASLGELAMLQAVGIDPTGVLYSNTVKPASHIAGAAAAGVWRFAVDSEGEIDKIARTAPGSAIYVRVRVDDSGSVFPLSRKFGAEAHHARALLQYARAVGLVPYGLTFHVGSQCVATSAWVQALTGAGRLMRQLAGDGIRIQMLDIGGGFPARYDESVPSIRRDRRRRGTRPRRAPALPSRPGGRRARPAPGGRGGRHGRHGAGSGGTQRGGLAVPRHRGLPRHDGDPADRRAVALPAVVLALRPRGGRPRCPSP